MAEERALKASCDKGEILMRKPEKKNMFDKNLIVFINGKYKRFSEASVSSATHSLHYGTAVFEGIRAYETETGTAVFRLDDHIKRLFYSAKRLQMNLSFTPKEVSDICLEVLRKNNLKSAYIRPLVFYDETSLGIATKKNKTGLLIMAWEWGKYLAKSAKVKVSPFKRISEKSTVADAKISGHYANSFLATMDAKKDGFDEALLLDHDDAVAEGPGENIFFIKNKELHTPMTGKILPGITRDSVMFLAENSGYEIFERNIYPDEINLFEEAFFTGTAAEITPIKTISWRGKNIDFKTKKGIEIQRAFFKTVLGKDKKTLNWLTFV